jgi:CheY-specific phosphatase CheX
MDAALAESVREVLEKMFFADLVEPEQEGDPPRDIHAEVIFDGNPPGSFDLALDLDAARSAAADFLGEDPEDLTTAQMHEVVCELANMICGSVLSRVESSATFRLEKPRIVSSDEAPRPPTEAGFQAALGAGTLRAEIRMERAACPCTESAS